MTCIPRRSETISAQTDNIILTVGGMHCAACVARVERALTAAPGVELAPVNLATRQAKVRYNPRLTNPGALTEVVTDAGYEVEGTSREQRAAPLPGSGGQGVSPALSAGPGPEPAGVALHGSPGRPPPWA